MNKLANQIEQLSDAHKTDHMVICVELKKDGRPDCMFAGMEGSIVTRLGMIDILMRQLEGIREDLHESMDNNIEDIEKKKRPETSSIGPNEQKLRENIKNLPEHLQGPVNAIIDKVKNDLFNPKEQTGSTKDVKAAFVQDFYQEINKRFGFEGNALKPDM